MANFYEYVRSHDEPMSDEELLASYDSLDETDESLSVSSFDTDTDLSDEDLLAEYDSLDTGSDLWGGLKTMAGQMPSMVTDVIPETLGRAIRRGDVDLNESALDEWIQKNQDERERAKTLTPEQREETWFKVPFTDVIVTKGHAEDAADSIGYSLVNAAATFTAKAATTALLAPVLTPIGSKIAGTVAGFGAGTAISQGATKDQFIEMVKNEFLNTHKGEEMTPELQAQWADLYNEVESDADWYGFWEAAPETAGNLLTLGIAKLGTGKVASKVLSPLKKKIASSIGLRVAKTAGVPVAKLAAMLTEESITEMVTQKKQADVEFKRGFRDKPLTYEEALKEVLPMVITTTPVMGGAISGAAKIAKKAEVEELSDEDLLKDIDKVDEGKNVFDSIRKEYEAGNLAKNDLEGMKAELEGTPQGKEQIKQIDGILNAVKPKKQFEFEEAKKQTPEEKEVLKAINDSGKRSFGDAFQEGKVKIATDVKEARDIQRVANALKMGKVHFFDAGPTQFSEVNGFYSHTTKQIYLNKDSQRPFLTILGHESLHKLKVEQPDLYKGLAPVLRGKEIGFKEYMTKLNRKRESVGMPRIEAAKASEEFIADFVGESMAKPTFWKKLHQEDPTLTLKLAQILTELINKIKSKLGTKGKAFFKDIEAAENEIAKIYAEFKREPSEVKKEAEKITQPAATEKAETIKTRPPDTEGTGRRKAERRKWETREEFEELAAKVESVEEARELVKQMTKKAYFDALTGLNNKAAYLEHELKEDKLPDEQKKHKAILDIDNFSWINDVFGHEVGDKVLATFGKTITDQTKNGYRYGGEEIIITDSDIDNLKSIVSKVEDTMKRLEFEYVLDRDAVTKSGIKYKKGDRLTVDGIGVSYGIDKSFKAADEKLYAEKARKLESGERAPAGEIKRLREHVREPGEDRKDHERKAKKKVTPKEKPAPGSKIRTMRGYIKSLGGINFLNYKGEARDMPLDVKYLQNKKTGVPIDNLVDQLIDDNWLDPGTSVADFLEDLRTNSKDLLSRDRLTTDVADKKEYQKSKKEKEFEEELAWEPEAPSEGKYVQMKAEDLPVGKELTILEGKTATGWDVYQVTGKNNVSVRLMDGSEVELEPNTRVEVLKKDIDKTSKKEYKEVAEKGKDYGEKQQKFDFKFKEEVKGISDERVRMATTGSIASSSTMVRNVDEAASLLSHIRKSAQEIAYTVAVDKDGTIIEIHKYSKGRKDAAMVSTVETAGRILNIPNVAHAYFVHNHPSESTDPSDNDTDISHALGKALELKGVGFNSLVIAGSKYRELGTYGQPSFFSEQAIKPIKRTVKIPEKERVIVRGEKLPKINQPDMAIDYFKNQLGNQEGFLFLDVKNRVVGFLKFTPGEKQKTITTNVISTAEKLNASGFVFNSNVDVFISAKRKGFLKALGKQMGDDLSLHDIISAGKSLYNTGIMDTFKTGVGKRIDTKGNYKIIGSEELLFSIKDKKTKLSPLAQEYLDMLIAAHPKEAPKKDTKDDPFKGLRKEVAERMELNKGLGKPSQFEKIKKIPKSAWNLFTRSFEELDPKKYGGVSNVLRLHKEASTNSRRRASSLINQIIGGLHKNQYDIFRMEIIIGDMLKDIESGLLKNKELPFGFKNKTEVQDYYNEVLKSANANPAIKDALRRRNIVNEKFKTILVKNGLLHEAVLDDPRYFHHQVMEYRAAKELGNEWSLAPGTGTRPLIMRKKGWQKARKGSIKDYNTDYVQSEFEVLAQGIAQLETQHTLNRLKGLADMTDALKLQAKANGIKDWELLIPDNAVEWVPEPGSAWFKASSLTDRMMIQIQSGEITDPEIIKKVWAKGKDVKWIIPKGLAKTLNDFGKADIAHTVPDKASRAAMTAWKKWILINPYRIIKYNLNNMSGDFDITFAYDPKIMKYFDQALKDLWAERKGKALSKELKGEMDLAHRQGVIGSGWSMQDIAGVAQELSYDKKIQALSDSKPGFIKRAWRWSADITAYRENILRLAAYRYFKDRIEKGDKNIYAASNKKEVDAIKNDTERAAKLSRDLVGDYGNISAGGQWMRRHLIPFYSWLEVNAPRYVRLIRNLKHEGEGTKKGAKIAGLASVKIAWKGTKLAVKATALMSAVMLWNRTFFPDEEDELGESQRRQMHIILGRRSDGTVITLRFQGALSDALSWFGGEDIAHDINDEIKGKVPITEKAKDAALAPVIKVIHGIRPDVKIPSELLAGESYYPDPFFPRPIRDHWEHVARTFSLDSIERYLTGKPKRGGSLGGQLLSDIISLGFYTSDPGEAAFWNVKKKAFGYLEKLDIQRPRITPTDKANAMYYYKKALRYGDLKAAEKYLKSYIDHGGTPKGMRLSIKASSPLGMMTKKQQRKFIKTLTEKEKETLGTAEKWYRETYKNPKNAIPWPTEYYVKAKEKRRLP